MLDAIVVTFNSEAHIEQCLRQLDAAGCDRVVVVDNSPSDGTLEVIRAAEPSLGLEIKVLRADNPGFSGAVNLGAHESRPAADLLLVNPDAFIPPTAVKSVTEAAAAHPEYGALGARMLLSSGEFGISGGPYPSFFKEFLVITRLHKLFPKVILEVLLKSLKKILPNAASRLDHSRARTEDEGVVDMDWASGFFLFIRRIAWNQVGGFPSGFFMYFEDVALCRTLHESGWKVGIATDIEVSHIEGASSKRWRKQVLYTRGLRDYLRWSRARRASR